MVLFLLVLRDLGDHKVAPVKDFFQLNRKKISEIIEIVRSWTKATEEIILQVTESYQILGTRELSDTWNQLLPPQIPIYAGRYSHQVTWPASADQLFAQQ